MCSALCFEIFFIRNLKYYWAAEREPAMFPWYQRRWRKKRNWLLKPLEHQERTKKHVSQKRKEKSAFFCLSHKITRARPGLGTSRARSRSANRTVETGHADAKTCQPGPDRDSKRLFSTNFSRPLSEFCHFCRFFCLKGSAIGFCYFFGFSRNW